MIKNYTKFKLSKQTILNAFTVQCVLKVGNLGSLMLLKCHQHALNLSVTPLIHRPRSQSCDTVPAFK